jgi:hypothetical protein
MQLSTQMNISILQFVDVILVAVHFDVRIPLMRAETNFVGRRHISYPHKRFAIL